MSNQDKDEKILQLKSLLEDEEIQHHEVFDLIKIHRHLILKFLYKSSSENEGSRQKKEAYEYTRKRLAKLDECHSQTSKVIEDIRNKLGA